MVGYSGDFFLTGSIVRVGKGINLNSIKDMVKQGLQLAIWR